MVAEGCWERLGCVRYPTTVYGESVPASERGAASGAVIRRMGGTAVGADAAFLGPCQPCPAVPATSAILQYTVTNNHVTRRSTVTVATIRSVTIQNR